MILTYKVKHNRSLSIELEKGRQVAVFSLKTKSRSSKDLKHWVEICDFQSDPKEIPVKQKIKENIFN